ncbi:N4-gp56 family major capsid protein [Candidatus Pacearchaeota archaeon]|nr:MAG: N4-gp56 family major capsid protein [Candidatus Pacearchaeota archaeon]
MEGIQKLSEETIKELGVTTASDVQGTSFTAYGLQPVQFLKEVVDAAKKQLYFANFVRVIHAPQGTKDVVIPKRSAYLGRSGVSFDTSEPDTSDITVTDLTSLDSVTATPSPVFAGVAISNYALRTNALNLVQAAKEELSYAIGDRVDRAIAVALGDATAATSSAAGAQLLYGGDATSDTSLSDGDVITTDLVAKAKRYLQTTVCKYWSSGTEGTSSATKNPWQNTADDPFVLFIGPAQEEVFLKDSQFVNAAEYGSDIVIQNGEIGSYLGIRIVVTNNVESVAAGTTFSSSAPAPDGTTSGTAATDFTRCILCKPKAACALVWGRDPQIKVFDYPQRDQTWITLVADYAVKVIHDDAIVWLDVADA